jgi:hypothetical protein
MALNAVTQDQWNTLGTGGNTFAGNLFKQVMANNGLSSTVYDATHNDPGTFVVGQKYGQTPEEIQAYAKKIDPYYQVTAAPPAQRSAANSAQGTLYDQLQQQAKQGGYSWTSESGNYNAFDAAGLLSKQGVSSLDQLGFAADGSLINKATGKPLTTREKDQLGMSAEGKGRVDYDIKKDANGNPVIVPKWKSSTTDLGVAGKLLPIAASFIPGFGPVAASALSAGLSIAQGGEAWDAIKAAGMTYAGHELGSWAGDKLGQYAADNGLSLPSFGSSAPTGTDYSLGGAKLGDGFTGAQPSELGSALFGQSTGTAGGTGAGLSLNPGTWGGIGQSMVTSPYLPSDYNLHTDTAPINNNGSGLSTAPKDPWQIGGSNSGLTVNPGQGLNLFQPTGSGGLLGTGGTSTGSNPLGLAKNAIQTNFTGYRNAAQLLAAGAGALAGGAEASGGSGSGYTDDGYRPTISQAGWSPTAKPTLGGPSGIGLISLKNKGQANDGLWRYGLLGG